MRPVPAVLRQLVQQEVAHAGSRSSTASSWLHPRPGTLRQASSGSAEQAVPAVGGGAGGAGCGRPTPSPAPRARHYLPPLALLPPHLSISITTSCTPAGAPTTSTAITNTAATAAAAAAAAGPGCSAAPGATHIVVINGGGLLHPGLVAAAAAAAAAAPAGAAAPSPHSHAAAAAAAGAWPTLPSWLFGFACGSTAATAAAVSYLAPSTSPQQQQQQQQQQGQQPSAGGAGRPSGFRHLGSGLLFEQLQHGNARSSGSSTTSSPGDVRAQLLSAVGFSGRPHPPPAGGATTSSSSSSSGCDGDGSRGSSQHPAAAAAPEASTAPAAGSARSDRSGSGRRSSSLWSSLLGSLGASAHASAAALEPAAGPPLPLPTPWEAEGQPATSSSSSEVAGRAAAAAAGGPTSSSSSSGGGGGGGDVMLRSSISEAAAAAAPAVVHLVVQGGSGSSGAESGGGGVYGHWDTSRPQGSGFIYDPAGFILTSAHVVTGSSPAVTLSHHTSGVVGPGRPQHCASSTNGSSSSSSWLPWRRWRTGQQQLAGAAPSTPGSSSVKAAMRLHHSSTAAQAAPAAGVTAAAAAASSSAGAGLSGGGHPGGGGGVLVHLSDGRVFEGRVVALDGPSDLAVVALLDTGGEALPAARLGASHKLRVGEWVVALGSPFLLKQSVSAGIVSCVGRKGSELGLPRWWGGGGGGGGPAAAAPAAAPAAGAPAGVSLGGDFIQTDAAINVGNSGGPLVNLDGEVVGMAMMKAAAADGVSFAVPIDTIKALVGEMSRRGRVSRPYAGITMAPVGAPRMAQLRAACPDFPAAVSSGIVVTRVARGSPAAAAGLREDDVIVGLGGQAMGGPAAAGGQAGPGGPGAVMVADEAGAQQGGGGRQLGLGVGVLADALKASIGGSLDLLVVREVLAPQQQQQGQQQQAGTAGSSTHAPGSAASQAGSSGGGSSGGRYQFVTVTVRPVEAAAA